LSCFAGQLARQARHLHLCPGRAGHGPGRRPWTSAITRRRSCLHRRRTGPIRRRRATTPHCGSVRSSGKPPSTAPSASVSSAVGFLSDVIARLSCVVQQEEQAAAASSVVRVVVAALGRAAGLHGEACSVSARMTYEPVRAYRKRGEVREQHQAVRDSPCVVASCCPYRWRRTPVTSNDPCRQKVTLARASAGASPIRPPPNGTGALGVARFPRGDKGGVRPHWASRAGAPG
jgi:hypothetical protein